MKAYIDAGLLLSVLVYAWVRGPQTLARNTLILGEGRQAD
jgi:hypothetical protein